MNTNVCMKCKRFLGKNPHVCGFTSSGWHHTDEAKKKMSETKKKLFREGKLKVGRKRMGNYIKCIICNKEFYNSPSVKKRCCSIICRDIYLKDKHIKGEKHHSWKTILTKEELIDLYFNQKLSLNEIGKIKNINRASLRKRFELWNLQQRSFNEQVKIGINKNKEKFIGLFVGNKNPMYGKIAYPKARFVKELGHSVRSKWEEDVAFALKQHNIPYNWEGITLKVNGGKNTYTPDFVIKDYLIEVKGPLFEIQRQKMVEISKYSNLIIITSQENKDRYDFSFAKKTFDIENLNTFIEWIKNEI